MPLSFLVKAHPIFSTGMITWKNGGAAYFPQSLEEVDSITRSIAHDIRSQYTLAYNPGPNIGTGYQRIRVDVRGPARTHLTVRTRTGYYPGETVK